MKKITLLISLIFFSLFTNAQCNEPSNLRLYQEIWSPEIYIRWDENGEDHWDIEYGEMGFTQTGIPTTEDLSNSYFYLSGLEPVSSYIDFYVRADCEIETSDWVGPFTFYNHCFDWVWSNFMVDEAFNNGFLPACWTETSLGSPDTGIGLFGNSNWVQSNFANDTSNSLSAKVNISGTNVNEWLVLPPMLGLQGLKNKDDWHLIIDFNIALTEANTTSSATLGSDDVIKLVISPDLGETWFTLKTWDTNSSISNTGQMFNLYYPNYTDDFDLFENIFLVAFWASSGSVDDPENIDFFIDNVYAEPPATGSVVDLSSKGFSYYPNPSENTIQLTAKEPINQVVLYNKLGQKLKEVSINALSQQVDIYDLPNGIYFMQVHIGNIIGVVPIIKN